MSKAAVRGNLVRFLILIYLFALIVRLVPVLLTYNLPIGLDDMFQYDMLARSIVSGNGYRWYAQEDLKLIQAVLPIQTPADYDPRGVLTSHRGPGFPLFLAWVYSIAGTGEQRFFFARLAQAFLTATIAPLTYILAHQLGLQERTTRWAAGILAFYPLLIVYPLALVSENLFLVLLTLAVVLVLWVRSDQRWYVALMAGLVLGLAMLTRSVIAGFVPLALFWLWWSAPNKRRAVWNGAVLLAGFLAITTPWVVRNSLVHKQLVWVESSLGYNLYLGYHPQSQGTFQFGISLDLLPILDDAERDAAGRQAALDFIRADPGRFPYLLVRKLGYFWGLDRRALGYFYSNGFFGYWPPWLLGAVMVLDTGPLLLLAPMALIGMVCGRLTGPKTLLLILLIYYTGIHMLILAEPRFHLPLLPLVAILAMYALFEHPWFASRPWQRYLALILVALLLFNWSAEIVRDWDMLSKLFGPEGHHLGLNY